MTTTSFPTISNNVYQGAFDAAWASVFSLMDFPQWYPELSKKYGGAFELMEFLTIAGQVGTIKASSETLYEEGAPERKVTTYAAISTASAGSNISVKINEWGDGSTGVSGQSYLTVGDKIAIPAAYVTVSGSKPTLPQWYQVVTKGTLQSPAADTVFTCTPLLSTVALAVQVPSSTSLMVTGGNYAPGSQGAKPKSSGWYSRTFSTAIKRAAFKIQGSQQSTERYYEKLRGGGMGIFTKASIEAEFRLNHAKNYEILLGTLVNNLTMTDSESQSVTARGTEGLLPHLASGGCKQYYTSSFDIPDVDLIKDAYISQGVLDTEGALFVGSDFNRGLENNAADWVKEFSGGTDFMASMDALKVQFKVIKKNGITLTVHELKTLSNPNTLDNYGAGDWAFVVPQTQVTVRESMEGPNVKMPNLRLAYKSYNGEDRTHVVNFLPGVNGLNQIPGNLAISSYDEISAELLSEFALEVMKRNQMILIQPSSVL